ncbi:PhoH family protein [Sulfuriflexus mobilis]|uniref:PhoH family protein n=1 Tax=Sulfuriflexus mobilis TaxID=1811807 RepID=UPI000F840A10|nr:PhoH family protein [Sulfuriflexus mobilis]
MSPHPQSNQFVLDPPDNQRLANLCGQFDEHLRQIERSLGVEINNRGNQFQVIGEGASVRAAGEVLNSLYAESATETLNPASVHLLLQGTGLANVVQPALTDEPIVIRTKRGQVKPRTPNQQLYVKAIHQHDINFGVGPAGTGKTYLAVATAVEALERDEVRRILLVRPAVEAGERLGFLPGDLAQKVDPYLRPLYDALYEMMGFEKVARLTERNVIEVAPLAYMRGRTLNESFVILDEAQNTSIEQMKMFLTRIGFGSKAVITGDVTQIDLPAHQKSGLRHVIEVLKDVDGISFNFFQSRDVVRHPLVARIVNAYEDYEQANPDAGNKRRD